MNETINKLDKRDVLWIFALKDGRTKEHYKKYYGTYEGEPTDSTLFSIISQVIDRANEWEMIMRLLRMDRTMYRMLRFWKRQKEEPTITMKKTEPTFEEWMIIGMNAWAARVTIYMLDEWCCGNHWHKWVDEERATYEKEEKEND